MSHWVTTFYNSVYAKNVELIFTVFFNFAVNLIFFKDYIRFLECCCCKQKNIEPFFYAIMSFLCIFLYIFPETQWFLQPIANLHGYSFKINIAYFIAHHLYNFYTLKKLVVRVKAWSINDFFVFELLTIHRNIYCRCSSKPLALSSNFKSKWITVRSTLMYPGYNELYDK